MEKQLSFLKTKAHEEKTLEIFTDGASRGNPGFAGAGIYIKHDKKELLKKGFFLGEKTNNQSEYLALALSLFFAKSLYKKYYHFIVFSDSELLTKQMNGEYKIKNPILHQIKNLIDSMLKGITFEIKHILREKNSIADKLANDGINNKQKMPKDFIELLNKYNIKI